ncbi:unnamed protein product [Darwinula stevensoni]|uniref:Uncharacterized protein n=1 Tax=Darwinula stevensoni TaxID=69355 RepID=A0A7R9A2M6_9CRUS|nr:unnamed protein product [Darwinula stevensoni]CAG0889000.1 unnamed protein product [Darwinula stevensoni]
MLLGEFDQLAKTWLLRYLKDRPTYLDFLSRLSPEDHVKIMQNRDEFIRICIFKENDCRKYFLPFLNTTYTTNDEQLRELTAPDTYTYLGVEENSSVAVKRTKQRLTTEYKRRVGTASILRRVLQN